MGGSSGIRGDSAAGGLGDRAADRWSAVRSVGKEDRAREVSRHDHGLQRLPHALQDGTEGARARYVADAFGAPRRYEAPAAAEVFGPLGCRGGRQFRVGRPLGNQLYGQPDAGQEHGTGDLDGGHVRQGDEDGQAHGDLAGDPAADAMAVVQPGNRRGLESDLCLSQVDSADRQPCTRLARARGAAGSGVTGKEGGAQEVTAMMSLGLLPLFLAAAAPMPAAEKPAVAAERPAERSGEKMPTLAERVRDLPRHDGFLPYYWDARK